MIHGLAWVVEDGNKWLAEAEREKAAYVAKQQAPTGRLTPKSIHDEAQESTATQRRLRSEFYDGR